MLSITSLSAGYENLQVLKDVSITVKPGEIVALIGPNGAGKSTVLKSIFGLTHIIHGTIEYEGKHLTRLQPHHVAALGISYVPQGRINFYDLTVEENLEVGAIGKDRETIKRMKQEVYKKFPLLHEKRNAYAFSLSGGQQQVLALGRALMQNQQLLLLDEPSLGLSPKATTEIFKDIKRIADNGIGILIVEQNAKKAVELSDRTYLLEEGTVVLEGDRKILQHTKIKSVYLGGRY